MGKYFEEITYDGQGFCPVVNYKSWRVAYLNYGDETSTLQKVEKHPQTDEVFLLLKGRASLIIGTDESHFSDYELVQMMPLTIYNIKESVWHHILMDEGTSVLIVEEANTTEEISKYANVPEETVEIIMGKVYGK